jgi:hypothetical protein
MVHDGQTTQTSLKRTELSLLEESNNFKPYIYIYSFLHACVATPMCISLDSGYIWPDEVYVDEVYDRTRPSTVVCMSSMQVYVDYMVILIIYIYIL